MPSRSALSLAMRIVLISCAGLTATACGGGKSVGLAAWTLSGGRLHREWSTSTPGTSPVVAGGLLYVYNPNGGLVIYQRAAARNSARSLPAADIGTAPSSPTVALRFPRETQTSTR
jgi:hypothetical protein